MWESPPSGLGNFPIMSNRNLGFKKLSCCKGRERVLPLKPGCGAQRSLRGTRCSQTHGCRLRRTVTGARGHPPPLSMWHHEVTMPGLWPQGLARCGDRCSARSAIGAVDVTKCTQRNHRDPFFHSVRHGVCRAAIPSAGSFLPRPAPGGLRCPPSLSFGLH